MSSRLWLLPVVLLGGCSKLVPSTTASPSSKLKDFLAKSDVVLVRTYFDRVTVQGTKSPDKLGLVSLTHTPGYLTLLPETVEATSKQGDKVRGAYLTVQEEKWAITGGLGGTERGPDVRDESAIDDDELVDLEHAIEEMQKTAIQWRSAPPKNHTEISFEARDRFTFRLLQGNPSEFQATVGRATIDISEDEAAKLLDGIRGINSTLKSH